MRFVYIDDYRYSADLDLTVLDGTSDAAEASLGEVLEAAREHCGLTHLELTDGDPLRIEYVGPLGAAKPRRFKLDVAADEYVESVAGLPMRGIWEDLPEAVTFSVYPIQEIAGEKLRCIIQRVQCRDLYDLFCLGEGLSIDFQEVRPLLDKKAEAKGIDATVFANRFEDRIDRYRDRWDDEMSDHLRDVPRFDDVARIVRRRLRQGGLLGK